MLLCEVMDDSSVVFLFTSSDIYSYQTSLGCSSVTHLYQSASPTGVFMADSRAHKHVMWKVFSVYQLSSVGPWSSLRTETCRTVQRCDVSACTCWRLPSLSASPVLSEPWLGIGTEVSQSTCVHTHTHTHTVVRIPGRGVKEMVNIFCGVVRSVCDVFPFVLILIDWADFSK